MFKKKLFIVFLVSSCCFNVTYPVGLTSQVYGRWHQELEDRLLDAEYYGGSFTSTELSEWYSRLDKMETKNPTETRKLRERLKNLAAKQNTRTVIDSGPEEEATPEPAAAYETFKDLAAAIETKLEEIESLTLQVQGITTMQGKNAVIAKINSIVTELVPLFEELKVMKCGRKEKATRKRLSKRYAQAKAKVPQSSQEDLKHVSEQE